MIQQSTSRYLSEETKTLIWKDTCTPMFTAALFTIAKIWKQPNELEIGNLPEKEFRIIIVKVIQDIRKRMEAKIKKMQEMFNKDL